MGWLELGWLELGWLVRGRTALSPMHSLSRAQFVQSGRLSLQMPADTIVTDRARANSFIIVGVFRRDKAHRAAACKRRAQWGDYCAPHSCMR